MWLLTATPGRDQTGTTTLTLTALNDAGLSTNTAIPVTVVQPTLLPAQALGSSNLSWEAWGHAPWQVPGDVTPEGFGAIQTGALEANQEAWLETTVIGPGRLRYWWKVSSEENFDWLELYIDDRLQTNRISGEVDWQQKVVNLTGGAHTLHWRYAKDADTVSGLDTAWVGQVSFLPGAVLELPGGPADGWCPLLLYGASDRLYDVQVSTNLTTWSRLELVQGSSEVLQLTDTNAFAPSRFYRLQPIWLEPVGLTTNGFQLILHSPPDLRFDLQASPNLLDWTTLLSPTGALSYTDISLSNAPQSFYRALLLPDSPGDSPR
ncbi:MAG TPA: hypothetical protein VNZ22_06925, partial [Bacillota bacterium]|nr:hypothetical protein [Bacillota bacterium]